LRRDRWRACRATSRKVSTFFGRADRIRECVFQLGDCELTFRESVNRLHECMNRLRECMNTLRERMNTLHECMDTLHECMNTLHECMNTLHECMNTLHECAASVFSNSKIAKSGSESPLILEHGAVSEITLTCEGRTRRHLGPVGGAIRWFWRCDGGQGRAPRGGRLTDARVGVESPTYGGERRVGERRVRERRVRASFSSLRTTLAHRMSRWIGVLSNRRSRW
jgi:hypothetical protein